MYTLPDSLDSIQRDFYAALLHGSMAVEARIEPGELSAQRRVEIYRHNVRSNLRGALQAVYPVVLNLVGEAFFNEAADQYARAHPSHCGDLNQFGEHLAHFLAHYPHAADLVYLADVARLEWAWHRAFHAADAAALDAARLASVAPEEYGALRFKLAPAVRVLHVGYPVLRIWEVNQPDYAGDMSVDLARGGEHLLVARDGYTPSICSISLGEYELLDGLQRHMTLEEISQCENLPQEDDFLSRALQTFVLGGVIVDFALGNV